MKNKHTIVSIGQKKYLSIGEVADQFGLSVEVLRKWERDFPRVLHPMRTKGDSRLYDQKQVERVALIHRLLRVEGLSIDGAKRRLSTAGQQDSEVVRQEVLTRLSHIRQQLMEVVDQLDALSAEQQPGSNSTTSLTAF